MGFHNLSEEDDEVDNERCDSDESDESNLFLMMVFDSLAAILSFSKLHTSRKASIWFVKKQSKTVLVGNSVINGLKTNRIK